jgi:acetylornithine deacetylase/succinyl-diaminopimelate desuccinylase-like protein
MGARSNGGRYRSALHIVSAARCAIIGHARRGCRLRQAALARFAGSRNAHRADEQLRLSDLAKATEVIALAITDLLR